MASVRPRPKRGHLICTRPQRRKEQRLAGWVESWEIKGDQVFRCPDFFGSFQAFHLLLFAHNLYFFTTIQMWQNVTSKQPMLLVQNHSKSRGPGDKSRGRKTMTWDTHCLPHKQRRTETGGSQGKHSSCLGLKFAFSGVRGQCACAYFPGKHKINNVI